MIWHFQGDENLRGGPYDTRPASFTSSVLWSSHTSGPEKATHRVMLAVIYSNEVKVSNYLHYLHCKSLCHPLEYQHRTCPQNLDWYQEIGVTSRVKKQLLAFRIIEHTFDLTPTVFVRNETDLTNSQFRWIISFWYHIISYCSTRVSTCWLCRCVGYSPTTDCTV